MEVNDERHQSIDEPATQLLVVPPNVREEVRHH